MSKKQWLALLLLFLTYLTLGATIFYFIESYYENKKIEMERVERTTISDLLHDHYVPSAEHDEEEILQKLSDYCGKSVRKPTDDEIIHLQWDYYNSFYFAYTVVSTIGYGNLAPTNTLSRILMIFYGLIGIPINGILLTQLGEFFSRVFIRAYQKYKSYKQRQSVDHPFKKSTPETRKTMKLAAQIFLYLTPGFIVFIFFPAILFSYYERWSYDQSVYYAFVTLTTIGFGDLVAGQDNTKGSGPFFIMYKIFLICWISFGLGYIVMIMTFIARLMRSKKITRLEHKLATNLKLTQSKIWNEFNKEVNYLRRVFNELQLLKVKRVYVDEYESEEPTAKFPRSNSFPNLRDLTIGGYVDDFIPHPRRRANSEVVPMNELARVVSETDLQRIDKNATFAAHAIVQPADFLAGLVNILGYIPPRDDFEWDQIEEQTDAQNETQQSKSADQSITNNCQQPQWTIGGEKFLFNKPRSRAASEIRLRTAKDDSVQRNTEWTWSGVTPTKLQEMMKDHDTTISSKDNKPYKKFASLALPITATKNFFPKWRKQFANKRSSDAGPNMRNAEKSVEIVDNGEKSNQQNNSIGPFPSYLDERRDSILRRPHYHTHTGGNLPNYLEGNNLLEETTLADFLRALTALHAQIGTVPNEYVTKPKRKLGTACPPKLPSLFTLFSNTSGSVSANQSNQNTVTGAQTSRRISLKLDDNNSGSSTPTSYIRKGSVPVKPRRFSLRPVATPASSPTPPEYESPRLSLRPSQRMDDRNLQEPVSMDPFIFVSPKKPFVNMEGLPGISSPIQQPSSNQRFSIRPAQLSSQPSPTSTKSTPTPLHTPKPLPKWKAGMLQRQITQMNLRRHARASSLSDIYSDKREKTTPPLSPLAIDNTKTIDVSRSTTPNQKTVTIMSPAEEMNITPKNERQDSTVVSSSSRDEQITSWRGQGDVISSTNPFIFDISKEPPTALNESMILNMHRDGIYPQRDSVSVYKPPSSVFQQKLVKLNDELGKTLQKGIQETNMNFKEVPLKMEKKQDDTRIHIIDNLGASTSNERSPESRKEKPSVLIDSYKPSLQVTIEKPTINPFEQYRAMTRAAQKKEDTDLKEIKIEKPVKK